MSLNQSDLNERLDFSLPLNLENIDVQPLAPVSDLQFLLEQQASEPVEVPAQLPEIGLKRKRKQQDEQNGDDALNGFDSSEEIANRAILLALKHHEEQKPFVANNGQTMEVVEFAQTEDNTDVSFDKPDIF